MLGVDDLAVIPVAKGLRPELPADFRRVVEGEKL